MGTMAKVVFYNKNDEGKFKVKKSFTTIYDGLQGVGIEILKQIDGFEHTSEPETFIENIISNYEMYVKYDNKKTSNISEKHVDFCYKIYPDPDNKEILISMSSAGKSILNKVSAEDFKKEMRNRLSRFHYDSPYLY